MFSTSQQLLEIQQQLKSISPLSSTTLKVTIKVMRLISLNMTSSFTNLKIPSDKLVLIEVTDIAFNDCRPCNLLNNIFLTHPSISQKIVNCLHIEPLSECGFKGDLEILNFDEEEFNQWEEVTDDIRDTLKHYLKESTFHEYLTNVDDCEIALKVN